MDRLFAQFKGIRLCTLQPSIRSLLTFSSRIWMKAFAHSVYMLSSQSSRDPYYKNDLQNLVSLSFSWPSCQSRISKNIMYTFEIADAKMNYNFRALNLASK